MHQFQSPVHTPPDRKNGTSAPTAQQFPATPRQLARSSIGAPTPTRMTAAFEDPPPRPACVGILFVNSNSSACSTLYRCFQRLSRSDDQVSIIDRNIGIDRKSELNRSIACDFKLQIVLKRNRLQYRFDFVVAVGAFAKHAHTPIDLGEGRKASEGGFTSWRLRDSLAAAESCGVLRLAIDENLGQVNAAVGGNITADRRTLKPDVKNICAMPGGNHPPLHCETRRDPRSLYYTRCFPRSL